MDPIEESVRRALEGGDPADHPFRRSIYAASLRAMEKMIASKGFGAQEAESERARVGEVIERVENEYAAYYGSDDGVPPAPDDASHTAREADAAAPAAAGQGRAPASFAPAQAPREASRDGEEWRPGGAGRQVTRRRPGRSVLLALAFVLALALLLIVGMALFGSGSGETTGIGSPAATAPAGSETQSAAAEPALSWIDVFAGSNIEQVSTPSGARVASVDEAGRSAIRISGPQGGEGEVMIDLGPGLVQRIAGSDVRVEIVAGSPDGAQRQFSVRCVFGDASVCERQRFVTAMPEEAFVFDVAIPGGAATPANLAIGPSAADGGPDVDIYSVRMQVL